MNTLTAPTAVTQYAEQLARVSDPILIQRMARAGLNRAHRRQLISLSRKGNLKAHHFPMWLVFRFMAAGDGAFAWRMPLMSGGFVRRKASLSLPPLPPS